jgi:hypothetical protein
VIFGQESLDGRFARQHSRSNADGFKFDLGAVASPTPFGRPAEDRAGVNVPTSLTVEPSGLAGVLPGDGGEADPSARVNFL